MKYRQLKEEFTSDQNIKKINDDFAATGTKISDKDVKISIDVSAKNAWESSLCLYLDDIPFKSVGKGEQNAVKIKLALKDKLKKSDIIMIEEPETSLSFSNLNKLVDHLKVCCDGKQLLLSTHSSYLTNKTGLDKTILLNGNTHCHIKDLDQSTYEYFKKLPGYDTLRMLLSEKTILVEGPSDELIVQKAYLDEYSKLPIEDGIDVISVRSLAFKRFLNIAKVVKNNVVVVTDNDGSVDNLKKKYEEYWDGKYSHIKICFSDDETKPTLEPQILGVNDIDKLKAILEKTGCTNEELESYCKKNKTDVALKIFDCEKGAVKFPQYIKDAIK